MGKDKSWLFGKAGSDDVGGWNGIGVEKVNGARRVVRVDWYDEELVGPLPLALGNLTCLTYLFLGENYIYGTLPSTYGDLGSLKQLNLTRNQLEGTVPESWRGMTSLVEMGLYNNMFENNVPGYAGGEELRVYLGGLGGGKVGGTGENGGDGEVGEGVN